MITGFISGQPDYSAMAPEFAEETRGMLPRLRSDFTPLGELRSIKFRGPFMMGGDEFEIAFANGTRLMAIVLDPTGKIVAASPPMMVPPEN